MVISSPVAMAILSAVTVVSAERMESRQYQARSAGALVATGLAPVSPLRILHWSRSKRVNLSRYARRAIDDLKPICTDHLVWLCRPRNHPAWPDIDTLGHVMYPDWLPDSLMLDCRDESVRKAWRVVHPDYPRDYPYWNSYRYSTRLMVERLLEMGRSVEQVRGLIQKMADNERKKLFSGKLRRFREQPWTDGFLAELME